MNLSKLAVNVGLAYPRKQRDRPLLEWTARRPERTHLAVGLRSGQGYADPVWKGAPRHAYPRNGYTGPRNVWGNVPELRTVIASATMRLFSPLLLHVLLLPSVLLPTASRAQHLTYNEWMHRSMTDIRLQPRYGEHRKTVAQQQSDSAFRAATLIVDSVPRSASQRVIDHGFHLLGQGDLMHAMYRFNQGWLVDSTNAEAYWGYGAFFMELDRPAVAMQWMRQGLALDSANTHLLTGMATAALAEQHTMRSLDAARADDLLNAAIALLQRSYAIDPKDAGTLRRLAACHLQRDECVEAWRYFEEEQQLTARAPDDGFERHLRAKCPK